MAWFQKSTRVGDIVAVVLENSLSELIDIAKWNVN